MISFIRITSLSNARLLRDRSEALIFGNKTAERFLRDYAARYLWLLFPHPIRNVRFASRRSFVSFVFSPPFLVKIRCKRAKGSRERETSAINTGVSITRLRENLFPLGRPIYGPLARSIERTFSERKRKGVRGGKGGEGGRAEKRGREDRHNRFFLFGFPRAGFRFRPRPVPPFPRLFRARTFTITTIFLAAAKFYRYPQESLVPYVLSLVSVTRPSPRAGNNRA